MMKSVFLALLALAAVSHSAGAQEAEGMPVTEQPAHRDHGPVMPVQAGHAAKHKHAHGPHAKHGHGHVRHRAKHR